MKIVYAFCFLAFVLFGNSTSWASRGDLISYEELAYLEHEDVSAIFSSQFEGFLDPEENPEFFALATAYFNSLIDQRNITIYKLIYETIDFYNDPAQASGIILIPDHDQYNCSKSFSLYAHGTVFAREGVNSRPAAWGGEFMLTLMMASINTICVAPDYYGLGDGDGFHHHSHYKTNATSSLDIIRAGRNLCDQLGVEYNNRVMPMGYSEGGHASMALSLMVKLEGLENEFALKFIGAGSGAYDMSGEAFNFIVGNPFYPTRQYILYQVASCQDMYEDLILEEEGEDVSTYLKSPYDELYTEHVLGQTGQLSWVPSPWPQMFQPGVMEEMLEDPNHPFRRCLARSNVFNWLNTTPTLMYYCVTDQQVPYTAALKTRDVQRSLIPWWLFWQRFKIQAIDLTLGNTIPSHEACALPSIFVQLAVMSLNLGLDCEFTGRAAEVTESLRTTSGEYIGGKTLYASKIIDLQTENGRGPIRSITGGNLQTGSKIEAYAGSELVIEENGFYILKVQYADGTEHVTWLLKTDPDLVNTDDYDPIRSNPMVGRTWLDLSLLDEDVRQVVITDSESNEHFIASASDIDGSGVFLERTPSMAAGDYLVEVRTARYTFPLRLKVADEPLTNALSVYPNPVANSLHIDLGACESIKVAAEVVDIKGSVLRRTEVHPVNCSVKMDVEGLNPGIYTIRIAEGQQQRCYEFVKL